MSPRIQVSGQFLTAGSGGIARCARLTMLALAGEAQVSGLAVEDLAPTSVGGVRTRTCRGNRAAFVAANALGGLTKDWVLYDFAGTARAHTPLALLGKPYALWVHGLEVWPGYLRDDYARAVRGAKAVFVNSHHTKSRMAESLPDLTSVHVCQLGTEADPTAPPTFSAQGRERMVLFVGRSDELFAKGQDVLINAWPGVVAQVPDAVLCFVGGGERLDRLQQTAAASPASASIRVLGRLDDAEVDALRRRARLFAMLSNVEGFGLVFAEAMSHGLPVLTADEDASAEVNRHGETGYSIRRGNLAEVTETIVRVLTDDALFETLASQAYERWRSTFSFSVFRRRFLQAAADAGLLRRRPSSEPVFAEQLDMGRSPT